MASEDRDHPTAESQFDRHIAPDQSGHQARQEETRKSSVVQPALLLRACSSALMRILPNPTDPLDPLLP